MKRAFLVTVLLLVACSGNAPVQSDYNPSIDFSAYDSFSFDQPVIQASEGSVAHDPRVLETIRRTIEDDLRARPMTHTESGGDISIAISLAAGEETAVDQWGMAWDRDGGFHSGGDTFEFKAGTLVIDFFDAESGQLAWRSWVHSAVTRTDDPDLDFLAQLVSAMLADYPPASEGE
jgi:hypothetical protein